jgi:hypothetical protein
MFPALKHWQQACSSAVSEYMIEESISWWIAGLLLKVFYDCSFISKNKSNTISHARTRDCADWEERQMSQENRSMNRLRKSSRSVSHT